LVCSQSTTRRLVDAAVGKALTPWKRRHEIRSAIESAALLRTSRGSEKITTVHQDGASCERFGKFSSEPRVDAVLFSSVCDASKPFQQAPHSIRGMVDLVHHASP
jgi:hypothetical protein